MGITSEVSTSVGHSPIGLTVPGQLTIMGTRAPNSVGVAFAFTSGAVVAGEDDDRVLAQARFVQRLDDPAHQLVHVLDVLLELLFLGVAELLCLVRIRRWASSRPERVSTPSDSR